MNLLKLPPYDSIEVLRERLLYAIEAGAGFELS
jgi:ubiquitin-protein ligase E3 C